MELRRYASLLWRWLWLIVLGAVLAGGAAYFYSSRQVPVYQASTMLLISQAKAGVSDVSSLYVGDRLAATNAELLRRQPVMAEVVRQLELKISPGALAGAVRVTPIRNTQLMQLSVEDTDPQRAALIANTVPKVFIQQNDEMQTRRFADSKARLQKQLQQMQNDIVGMQESLARLQAADNPDAAAIDTVQRNLREQQTSYSTLYRSYEDLRLEEARQLDTLLIAEDAQAPTAPIRPKTRQNVLLAAAIGAMLAAGIAFLVEYLDDTIKNPDELQEALGLTTLSMVPAIDDKDPAGELPVIANTHSAATEAYRVLRTNLQFAAVGHPLGTLLVTSASPTEGKSMTAGNLSAALAQGGKRVILVDTDLHRPRQHRLFKLRNNVGITSALLDDQIDLEMLIQETAVPNLRVLTSGPLPPNAAELLGTARMAAVLAELKGLADIVILDSPPVMALADSAILATQTDGVLLVLDATNTRRELAKRAVASLRQVQAYIVGSVINRIPTSGAGSYYYYYYYSHYGNYYGSQNGHGDGAAGSGRQRRHHRSLPARVMARLGFASSHRQAAKEKETPVTK
jgi:capsular exopolysaccharide synthesis family protein